MTSHENLVARTTLRNESRDECRWNYITYNDQVAGSIPAGCALCGECVRSSAVEQVPEGVTPDGRRFITLVVTAYSY